jgi:hypothetical protein
MYFVKPKQPNGIPYGVSNRGCIVTTVAGTTATPASPISLGDNWDTSAAPPSTCPLINTTTISTSIVTGPNSNSNAIPYGYLTQAAVAGYPALQNLCEPNNTNVCIWGEPAIMVLDNALTGNTPTAFLAVDCHTQYVDVNDLFVTFNDYGYFIFSTTDLTLGTNGNWSYYESHSQAELSWHSLGLPGRNRHVAWYRLLAAIGLWRSGTRCRC